MERWRPFKAVSWVGLAALAAFSLSLAIAPEGLAQGKWEAPAEAKKTKNPVKATPDVIEAAKKIAQTQCAPCHGMSGKGDGPAAASLPVKPADWTSKRVQSETDGEIFWKISNGRGPMPPWKQSLSEKDRWGLVHYIRTLAKK